jgi:hypothetical protein
LTGWVDYDRPQLPSLNAAERIDYFEKRVRLVVINPLERMAWRNSANPRLFLPFWLFVALELHLTLSRLSLFGSTCSPEVSPKTLSRTRFSFGGRLNRVVPFLDYHSEHD